MKMISMLIALAIIGLVVWKQLGGSGGQTVSVTSDAERVQSQPPKISSNPAKVQDFDAAMDLYMGEQSAERQAAIDEQIE